MTKSFYDIVIAGTELAGIIFGALAAKNGFRVLLIGNDEILNTYRCGNFHFVRYPNLFTGFSSSQIIKKIFEELAMNPEMKNIPKLYSPSYQIILPDRRVSFYKEKEWIKNEFNREFLEDYERIEKLRILIENIDRELDYIFLHLPPLPPKGLLNRFKYRKWTKNIYPLLKNNEWDPFKEMRNNSSIRSLFFAPLYFLSRNTAINPVSFFRNSTKLLEGFYYIRGGMDRFKKILYNTIERNSGNVELNEKIERIIIKGDIAREIEIKGKGDTIGFNVLVCAMNPVKFLSLFDGLSLRKIKKFEKNFALHPSHFLWTLNLGVKSAVLPEGLGKICFLIQNPSLPFDNSNFILLSVNNAMEGDINEHSETSTITTFSLLRNENLRFSVDFFRGVQEDVFKKVEFLIPFLSQYVVEIDSPSFIYKKEKDEWVLNKEALIPYFSTSINSTLGLSSLPLLTQTKNVFYAGDHYLSGIGFEGCFLGARMVFEIVKKIIKRKI